MKLFYLGSFGLLGVFSRYYMGIAVSRMMNANDPFAYPYGTFFINLIGAFLIGVTYVISIEKLLISDELRFGLIVGFLGGFTTFSSYTLEVARLLEESKYLYAALYFSLSPILGMIAVFGGLLATRLVLGRG